MDLHFFRTMLLSSLDIPMYKTDADTQIIERTVVAEKRSIPGVIVVCATNGIIIATIVVNVIGISTWLTYILIFNSTRFFNKNILTNNIVVFTAMYVM